jgi:hypothetical protein
MTKADTKVNLTLNEPTEVVAPLYELGKTTLEDMPKDIPWLPYLTQQIESQYESNQFMACLVTLEPTEGTKAKRHSRYAHKTVKPLLGLPSDVSLLVRHLDSVRISHHPVTVLIVVNRVEQTGKVYTVDEVNQAGYYCFLLEKFDEVKRQFKQKFYRRYPDLSGFPSDTL